MSTRMVPGFLPSAGGFRFANAFPNVPLRRIGIPGVVSLSIGDASNGLCGGMVFAARDYFERDRPPPADEAAPGQGALFEYLVDRLFSSFNLPFGPGRYLGLMNPHLQDGETIWSRIGVLPHGRAWRMAREEWPAIRAEIDGGHPSPLGLVRAKSTNAFDLKKNHQVLSYGYDLVGNTVRLHVYDPNLPRRDDIALTFALETDGRQSATLVPTGSPIFGFLRVNYAAVSPP